MNLFELSAKISVDDTNFKKSMENAQKVSKNVANAMKELQSPLDKAKSGFNAIAHPVETAKANIEKLKSATEAIRHPIEAFRNKVADASTALETKRNKLSALAAGYDSAKKKVDDLTKEFNKSAKESGTSSQKTQELAKKLNEAEKEAEEAKKELDDYSASVSKAGKNSDSASKGVGNFASKLGKGLATAGKVAGAALGVAAAGVTALTTQAVNSFAEYEQLAGGAQKIFNDMDYSKIATDANNAYKELGLSTNQYLAVINDVGATFAATMGDEAGYEAAKTGLKAISDYASGTGKNVDELSQKFTLITRSTSSYQSIADQFSGILPATSDAFLEQAQAAGILSDNYTKLTEVPIDEYQAAVSQMLQKGVTDLGLANNTMNEAFSTLSGSLSMAKGAWSNLVTGLADDSADLDMLIGNFVESVGAVATNIIPKIGTALNGASKLMRDLIPVIVQEIPVLIEENLPVLAEAAISIIQSLVDGISENQEMLMTTAFETITYLANSIITMLPQIVQLGLDLIVSLANGIAESLPELIPTIVDVILQIVETLTNPSTLSSLVEASIAIILGLAQGLISAIPQLVEAIPTIIQNIITALVQNIPLLIQAGIDLFVSLVANLPSIIAGIVKAIPEIIVAIIEGLGSLGGQLADLFSQAWEGIKNIFSGVGNWFSEKFTEGKEKASEAWSNAKEVFSQHWENVKAGFAAVGDWFSEKFTEGKENASNAWNNAKQLFSTHWENVKSAFSSVGGWFTEKFTEAKNNASAAWDNAKSIFSTVWGKIKSGFNISDALTWGRDMIQNFINGITAKWQALKNKVSSVAQTVKNFLGFSEPKEGPLSNFHTYAPDMMDLFAKGIRDNENVITDQIEKSFDFGERTIKFGAEYGDGLGVAKSSGMAYGGTSIGNITINIDGAKYDDEQSLAEAVSEALQNMTDRRSAVYA